MGYLRLWLAVSVMLVHFGAPASLQIFNGGAAVRSFFVLSGYVIALVLDGRYRDRTRLYLKLRLLRIFPVYFVVLAVTTVAWSVVWFRWHLPRGPVAYWAQNPPGAFGAALLLLQQVVVLGMEWFLRFNWNGHPVIDYMMVAPAWTLAVELSFYLVSPWLIKAPSRWLWASVAFTVALKAISDPTSNWGAALLPFELGFFSLGILGYRWQKGREMGRKSLSKALALGATAFLALPYFLTSVRWQDIAAPIVAASVLPALHRLGEKWPLDREAGEVSYTLYLLHPVSGLMMAMLIKGIPIWPRTLILTAGSLAAATGLWWLVERPMTRLRRHLAA